MDTVGVEDEVVLVDLDLSRPAVVVHLFIAQTRDGDLVVPRRPLEHQLGDLAVVELHVVIVQRVALVPDAVRVFQQAGDVVGRMGMVELEGLLGHRPARLVQRRHDAEHVREVLVGLLVEDAPTAVQEPCVVAELVMAILELECRQVVTVVRPVHVEPQHRDVFAVPPPVTDHVDAGRQVPGSGHVRLG
jgi:hypothetical protein